MENKSGYALKRKNVAQGVNCSLVTDGKFKRNLISVNFLMPLGEKTVEVNSIVPALLKRGKDFKAVSRRLNEMYGADLIAESGTHGRYQMLSLCVVGISDRYALSGEKLSCESAELLSELIFSPNIKDGGFDEKDVAIEKENLIRNIEAEINDKRSYALNRCADIAFEGEPYGVGKGKPEGAARITPETAAEAYYDIMKHAAVEIMFVGDGGADGACKIFSEKFSSGEREPITVEKSSRTFIKRALIEKTEELEVAQGKLVMAFRTDGDDSVKRRAAIKMMLGIYGMTPFSKLFVNVREKQSLCYYCAVRFDRHTNMMTVDSGIEFENCEKARQSIEHELKEVANGNFTDEDIINTKLYLKNAYSSIGDSLGGLETWFLSQIFCRETCTPEEFYGYIEKVTREDIINAAGSFEEDTVYFLKGKDVTENE